MNDADRSELGYHLMGGVELYVAHPVRFDLQLRLNSAPGLIGNEGTSERLEEDDPGGLWLMTGVSFFFE